MQRQKHLLHVFPTFEVGGSQIRFGQLAKLHGTRYRHTVIALDGKYGMASRLDPGTVSFQKVTFNKGSVLTRWGIFRQQLRALKPDTLLTYNWGAIDWAVVNKWGGAIPHIHIEDGFGPEEALRQFRRRVWARRIALSGPETRVILPSHILKNLALEEWKLRPSTLEYVPNGVDCRRFSGPPRIEGNGPQGIVIGTVATLRREKNIARLINAFSAIAAERKAGAVRLLIVGDGPERQNLERLAASVPGSEQIIFSGPSSRPEDWLRKMDIFAVSSDTEQMPLSVLEAMASSLPIVSTKVGDVAEMVSTLNKRFVVAGDRGFESALESILNDRAARAAIGQSNAQRASELFDESVMATRYAEIIG
jgi:glycosyltransferase involved in cell wall biosynthesis